MTGGERECRWWRGSTSISEANTSGGDHGRQSLHDVYHLSVNCEYHKTWSQCTVTPHSHRQYYRVSSWQKAVYAAHARFVSAVGVNVIQSVSTKYRSVEGAFEDRDAVINLVALSPLYQPSAGRSHTDVHVRGTLNTVRAARDHGVGRLFQMSALGADASAPAAYFRAKAAAETAVRNSTLDWVMFRPSAMFGEAGHFIPFVRKVTTPYVTGLPGGGKTRFQPIWIGDSVPLFAEAIEDDAHLGETYELGGPEVVTLATVTNLVQQAQGTSSTVLPVPMPLAMLGVATVDPISRIPFGFNQVGALQLDTITDQNRVEAFGVAQSDLLSLSTYLNRKRVT